MEALRAALTMILGIVLPLALQLWDRRRLPQESRALTWGYASWGGALYAFGPLSMLGWIFVTRRPWLRCLVAVPYTMAPVIALTAVDLAVGAALGEPLDLDAGEIGIFLLVGPLAIVLTMVVIELVVRGFRLLSRRPTPETVWRRAKADLA